MTLFFGTLLIAAGIKLFDLSVPCIKRFGLTPATHGGAVMCLIAAVTGLLIVRGGFMMVFLA
ncbi:hypothetical protein [Arthrobacter sp. OAP107]|uniref:hypothetical protein n=1 Tax=Arthrobacter sp. OAP107 TaxID=3156445 RepID=UPI0033935606